MTETDDSGPQLKLFASYAYQERKAVSNTWRFGQGLVGQAALAEQAGAQPAKAAMPWSRGDQRIGDGQRVIAVVAVFERAGLPVARLDFEPIADFGILAEFGVQLRDNRERLVRETVALELRGRAQRQIALRRERRQR